MPVSAHDVARELRQRTNFPGVVKVHKMLYMCQGWHLAWYGEPMFVEDIEAWDNGPVVADLWRDEDRRRTPPPPENLGDRQLFVLDFVVSRYGHLTGRDLIEMTHSEGPWSDAFGRAWHESKVIGERELTEFFVQADRADREEASADDASIQQLLREASVPSGMPASSELDEVAAIRRWLTSVAG